MPSDEFSVIFDNAASIVACRCSGLPGLDTVLSDLKTRVQTDNHDPLANRELIIEPRIESQRLDVPRNTVDRIVQELHSLNVVHLWVRATCPAVEAGDDNTLIETDDTSKFRDALQSPCSHCGKYHDDLKWENVETFYAINFDSSPRKFDLKRLFRWRPASLISNDMPAPPKSSGLFGRFKSLFARSSQVGGSSVTAAISTALEANSPVQQLPPAHVLCLQVWKLATFGMFAGIGVVMLSYWLFDVYVATIVASMLVLAFAAATYITFRVITATPIVQRALVATGYGLSAALIAGSRFDVDMGISEGKPWHFSLKSHDMDWSSVAGAICLIAVTTLGACGHQYMIGWFEKQ